MASRLAEGMMVAERFRLERLLGQGGMGTVWRAFDERLQQPCAVKFIEADEASYPEMRARFAREARAAASLRSPHVVQILDHGEWYNIPYIAMELLEGEDLAHRLHRVGRLTAPEALAIVSQVGRALSKAHQNKIVHRDLKPENIFLVRDDDQEIAKVLDFGIAKVLEPHFSEQGKTGTGTVIGTPNYMSPEQARGEKNLDHRSDLWSLAAIVFECLTGKKAFPGEYGEVFVAILAKPLPVPSQVCSGLPPGFDDWWRRASARERDERYFAAREMVDALANHLGLAGGAASTEPNKEQPAPKVGVVPQTALFSSEDDVTLFWPALEERRLASVTGVAAPVEPGTQASKPLPWRWLGAGAAGLLGAFGLFLAVVPSPSDSGLATAPASAASAPASASTALASSSVAPAGLPTVGLVSSGSVAFNIDQLPTVAIKPAPERGSPVPRASVQRPQPAPSGKPAPASKGAQQCDQFGICKPK